MNTDIEQTLRFQALVREKLAETEREGVDTETALLNAIRLAADAMKPEYPELVYELDEGNGEA